MNDIIGNFGRLYHPQAALVFYQTEGQRTDTYVEYFDMDESGKPINAHPLTIKEANALAKALKTAKQDKEPCLQSGGIIGSHILSIETDKGKVVWFTKAMQRDLYFTEDLGIPNGKAHVPPMLWMADRDNLYVFALRTNGRPTPRTKLYNAPFFNVYANGNVCMGTVDIHIKRTTSLEAFTAAWENYFFNSYFSHLMRDFNPIKGNCVCLWERLITTGEAFPKEILEKSRITLKDVLNYEYGKD
ncbi:PRTRC system protein B [Parafilimonas terrae]|uniref:PRTRC system protein B n=1 Tax=Parafilimonas terrae TaxID=1465490 RepID=A0A1I5TC99_9BACT|nr:PRTRC system protein B [Parafilimonas terrae]SFP80287.1 PRTRC system protein B [Parafilimonas terrae]